MKLDFIELQNLKPSPINVRKNGDIKGDDLVPSIRSLGVLQPLLVRKNCEGFEIIAGQRRYDACLTLSGEQEIDPVPCVIMEEGDDAKAIEASLAENIARLPMDEIDQYKAFSALVKQGKDTDDIAANFGVTKRLVEQRLAIANLYSPILKAYRKDEVRACDIRSLTMASTRQQREWWKLSKEDNAPTGYALKHWLFGGAQIPTTNALFDLDSYKGAIISDLFGEDSYFADEKSFWESQSKAIAERVAEYRDDGWQDVEVLDVGVRFKSWEHAETPKEKGGRIYVSCSHDGEISFFEGFITQKEFKARQKAKSEGSDQPRRPETTKAMDNYLDLHKHAAVRAALLNNHDRALRIALAQIIAGGEHWYVKADPQKAMKEATEQSLSNSPAQIAFAEERGLMKDMLALSPDDTAVSVFEKLTALSDEDVSRILTFLVAQSLVCGSKLTDYLGSHFEVNMSSCWSADDAFFELLHDKKAINEMVREVVGDNAADANITSTGKVQKDVIRQALSGKRKAKVGNWIPRYLGFPRTDYVNQDAA